MSTNNGATQTNTGSTNKKETGFLASLFGSANTTEPVAATNTSTAQLGGRRKNKNKSRKNKNKNKSRKNKNKSRKNKNKNKNKSRKNRSRKNKNRK